MSVPIGSKRNGGHSSECDKAKGACTPPQLYTEQLNFEQTLVGQSVDVVTLRDDVDISSSNCLSTTKYRIVDSSESSLSAILEEDPDGFIPVLPKTKRQHKRSADEIPSEQLIADLEKDFIDLSFKVSRNRDNSRHNYKEKKRRKFKQRKNKAKRMKPHGFIGDDVNDILSQLSSMRLPTDLCSSEETQTWFSHFENLVILAHLMYKAEDMSTMCAAICAYVKMNTRRSLTVEIFKVVDDLVGTHVPEQVEVPNDEEFEPHAWNGRHLLDNWKLLRCNPAFAKMKYLIAAAMSLVACEITQVEWSPFGLKLISIEALKQQVDAVSFLDSLIETFIWCCETGWQVFQQKSLKPILYGDQAIQDFNESCDYVMANSESALAGNMNVEDFEFVVDKVLNRISEMKQVQRDGPTALWLQTRYAAVVDIKHKLVAKHKNTEVRFAPCGWALTGPTGVGKSTLSKLTMACSLKAMGFSHDPNRIITKDKFDKYDSTQTSDILGIYFDDVGNGKPKFETTSPTDVLIKYFNNVAAQAVKAELNQKGVVFISFKCGVLTSNQEDYNVKHYSDCPESILRRFYNVRVSVDPLYRKAGTTLLDTQHPDLINNPSMTKSVWLLTIEECMPRTSDGGYTWEILTYVNDRGEKIRCQNMVLHEYLQTVVHLSRKHAEAQNRLLKSNQDFDNMTLCANCCLPDSLCTCFFEKQATDLKPHALVDDISSSLQNVVVSSARNAATRYLRSFVSPVAWANALCGFKPVSAYATHKLSSELSQALDDVFTPMLISIVPNWVFESRIFKRSLDFWRGSAATRDFSHLLTCSSVLCGASAAGLAFGTGRWRTYSFHTLGLSCFGYFFFFTARRARIEELQNEYLRRRDALPEHWRTIRDSKVAQGTALIATLVVGMKLFRMWSKALKPQSDEEVDFIRKKDSSPGWFGHVLNKIGVTPKGKNETGVETHLIETFKKSNLYWGRFEREDKALQCNIFFPRKSVALFPKHLFYENLDMKKGKHFEEIRITVLRHEKPGGKFSFKVHWDFTIFHPSLDLAMVYVPNCPDLKDKTKFFADEKPKGSHIVNFFGRNRDGAFQERVLAKCGYSGGHAYSLDMPTCQYRTKFAKDGACMSILSGMGNNPSIFGFHIGGARGYGRAMHMLQQDYEHMEEQLRQLPGVYLSALSGDIPAQQYGRPLVETTDIHPHALISKLDLESYIDVHGSVKLRTQQKSMVGPSILSDHVSEVCDVPNQWGKPDLRPNWKAYNATLEHIVNPADMFSPKLLEKARQDWLKPLKEKMATYALMEDFRPLTSRESILGVPGKRFLEPLKMSTSMGFPVFGPKSKHFDEIREGEVLIDRVPRAEVQDEMERLVQCWQSGQRGYPVTSATLKDEPTLLSSGKVRVFQAGSVALTILMRKYFLPIARFLGVYPLLSESAVGVNAFSQEWQELMEHAEKFGRDDKLLAWDYSKYDVRMSSQITRAVFACFLDLARIGGYDEESLKIMEMMICDIVHPLIDYNGIMIMAFNMNTSGNPLTVVINGAAGSIYVRMGFFHVYPNEEDFRSRVAALTYGDDYKGSVHVSFRDFNNISYQEFMLDHKIKITSPDKETEMKEFFVKDDVDFLKRKSNFIPEIGFSIGKLEENSIFKSLHQNVKSRTETDEQVAISCIEGAMHEWFAHGREIYNLRQEQMKQVCRRVNLPVPAVYTTYDERVEHWKEKYLSQSSDESSVNSI